MNTAERIARIYHDDGQLWQRGSRSITDVAAVFGKSEIKRRDLGHLERAIFQDGSALIFTDNFWDIGCSECFGVPEERHDCECPIGGDGHDYEIGVCIYCDEYESEYAHLTQDQLDVIASSMDADIRESVHNDLAPCTPGEFLEAYLAKDPEFPIYQFETRSLRGG